MERAAAPAQVLLPAAHEQPLPSQLPQTQALLSRALRQYEEALRTDSTHTVGISERYTSNGRVELLCEEGVVVL